MRLFERQWLVNLILWGNFAQLRDAALDALGPRLDGRTLIYRARVTEGDVRRSMVADLVANLFEGDAAALVAHLVREKDVAPGDVARVRARLKETDRG